MVLLTGKRQGVVIVMQEVDEEEPGISVKVFEDKSLKNLLNLFNYKMIFLLFVPLLQKR